MKFKFIALIPIFSFWLAPFPSADEITKKPLLAIYLNLEVKTRTTKTGFHTIEINIPVNETRSQCLFKARFTISNKESELALIHPLQIIDVCGVKCIHVDASPEMIKKAKIEFDCKWGKLARSPLDTVTLVL